MVKKVYRTVIQFLFSLIETINFSKVYLFEYIEIFRKRSMYINIEWSLEEQREFDTFWKENFGKKISNRWHKLYQSINGRFVVDYIPEWMFTVKYERKFNNYFSSLAYQNKSLCKVFFGDAVPKTVLLRDNEIIYDSDGNIIARSEVSSVLAKYSNMELVIKPTVGSSSGHGVFIGGVNEIQELFLNNNSYDHSIVQEKIAQSYSLAKLNQSSVNTIRIITYVMNGVIHHCPISVRIGANGSFLDNIHSGGLVIHSKDDGTLSDFAFRLGWGDNSEKYTHHPDSGVLFSGYKIGGMEKALDCAYNAHRKLVGIGIASWDICLDIGDKPIIIEVNLTGQSIWFPQVCSEASIFGGNSVEMISKIRSKNE